MNNIEIVLSKKQAEALCTLLSAIKHGSPLQGLYEAINTRCEGRNYPYRLEDADELHNVFHTPMLRLVHK